MTAPDLDAIRAREQAATPGPWEAYGTTVAAMTGPGDCRGCSGILSPVHEPSCYWSEIATAGEPDAEFIAHAREDVPKLLAALEQERAGTVGAAHALDEAEAYGRESDRIAARWRGRAERAEAERDRLRENLAGAREWRDRYAAAVAAVRALHVMDEHGPGRCDDLACVTGCQGCGEDWPCATIRALDEHLGDS